MSEGPYLKFLPPHCLFLSRWGFWLTQHAFIHSFIYSSVAQSKKLTAFWSLLKCYLLSDTFSLKYLPSPHPRTLYHLTQLYFSSLHFSSPDIILYVIDNLFTSLFSVSHIRTYAPWDQDFTSFSAVSLPVTWCLEPSSYTITAEGMLKE